MATSFSLIKKLILLVTFVSVLAISITSYLSFSYADDILKEKIGDQLLSESTVRGNSIEILFEARIKETQILSTDPMIQILVQELNDQRKDPNFQTRKEESRRSFLTQVQAFQELVGFSIGFEDVKIIGKDGMVLFSLARLTNVDYSQNSFFLRGLVDNVVDFEKLQSGKKMVVITPIFSKDSKRGEEPIGVLVAKMRTESVDQILLDRSGLGKTGEVYLVNGDFLMISESRFIQDAVFIQKVDSPPVHKCFENSEEMLGFYLDYREVEIYGSSYCAKDLGFVLLAEIDQAETVESILVLQDRIIQTGLAITAGMVVLAIVLSKSFSKPLVKLRTAANEIANGNFSVRTKIKTRDEIGDLSSSFDSMAQKLQDSLIEIKEKESVIKQQEDILLQFSDYSEKYCVCMVDIMNSTKITKDLSETDTSNFYRIFLNSTAIIVRNFGGIVVKNIGDALLFYFPNLDPQNDEVFKKTLDCCITMAESGPKIQQKLEEENLPTFNYRISATYGPVRVARLSTSSVNDIFGSTVNRCAKINRLGPANGVIIGQELYKNSEHLTDYSFKKIDDRLDEHGFTCYFVSRNSTKN